MATVIRCAVCDGKLLPGLGVSVVKSLKVHDGCKSEAMRQVYPHTCPECHGSGQVVTSWHTEKVCCNGGAPKYGGFGGFAGCEYCPHIKEEKTPRASKQCDLCEGIGRLENAPVPVMTRTGWKKA